jgi:hypothetical protein
MLVPFQGSWVRRSLGCWRQSFLHLLPRCDALTPVHLPEFGVLDLDTIAAGLIEAHHGCISWSDPSLDSRSDRTV